MSTSPETTPERLLAGLADLQVTLNDSQRVASINSESDLMRELSRDTLIGRPWLELVVESDRALAAGCLEAAVAQPDAVHRIDVRLDIVSNQ